MQKWTTSVINLSKRDEALEGFRMALKKQHLAIKSVKAEIEGSKEDIIQCQEKHEQLTTLRDTLILRQNVKIHLCTYRVLHHGKL